MEVVTALPLAGQPVMNLMKYSLGEAKLSNKKTKKLIELLEQSIKTPPTTGHITFKKPKSETHIEIYMSLEENHDVGGEITRIIKEYELADNKAIGQLMEQIGLLTYLTRIYYQSIHERLPDVFKILKTEVGWQESLFIDAEKHEMFLIDGLSKKLVPRLSITNTLAAEQKEQEQY